ncbi:MAG: hypothetical protein U0872_07625 [Planctomycetaceae bacterium]
MLDHDAEFVKRNPCWLATLSAYWSRQQELKQQSSEADGWVPRLTAVAEVPEEQLSGIHGRLIAFGYLKFELTAKDASLRYQLTPLGRMAVTGEKPAEIADAGENPYAQSA